MKFAEGLRPQLKISVGFPEFWMSAYESEKGYFDLALDVVPMARRLLSSPVQGTKSVLAHFLASLGADSFGAVLLLCLNGYGFEAVVIARTLFECAVNAKYLRQADEEEVKDFIHFHSFLKRKYLNALEVHEGPGGVPLDPAFVERIEGEWSNVKDRFIRQDGRVRETWSPQNLRQRASRVGLESLYVTSYAAASSHAHGDIEALNSRVRAATMAFEHAPSLKGISAPLQMAIAAHLILLANLDEAAQLGCAEELNSVVARYHALSK